MYQSSTSDGLDGDDGDAGPLGNEKVGEADGVAVSLEGDAGSLVSEKSYMGLTNPIAWVV